MLCYKCIRWHINWLYKSTILHHSCLKISMQSSTRLQFHVSFWARNNKKYLKIDIYLKHTSTLPFPASVTVTSKHHPLICSANGFYTVIILPISDNTSIYYFRFIEDVPYPFPQVFNQRRLISQKHNNKDTNWNTTQRYPTTLDDFLCCPCDQSMEYFGKHTVC